MYSTNRIIRAISLIGPCALAVTIALAVTPPPDGGYANQNTAEGDNALFSLTSGSSNTAIGFQALFNNTTGNSNTANGYNSLYNNTTGAGNTATGTIALLSNTTGSNNTANGFGALLSNTTGSNNTASGFNALLNNTTGNSSTAVGFEALLSNTTGSQNTAIGNSALFGNTTGDFNTAIGVGALLGTTTGIANTANGFDALFSNTTGTRNTATGFEALLGNTTGSQNTADGISALLNNTTGSGNIALGDSAGLNLTTGSNNVDIGNAGVAGESGVIHIGTVGTQTATFIAGIRGTPITGIAVGITADGQLGVRASSARFKDAIKPMDKASEAIFSLRPVTFRYKKALDPAALPQFGLVAEQVAKVDSDLVTRDMDGKPYSVRYEEVNAMLLNEFLKEHRRVEEQAQINLQQEAKIAGQQKEIAALTASLKAQATQIQKVSDQLGKQAPAPRVVVDN